MRLTAWQRFKKALGFKTIEDRIAKVHTEAALDEERRWKEFYQERDFFSHELEKIQDEEDVYNLGVYETPGGEVLAVNMLPQDFWTHKYIVGTTGTGKTFFIESLLIQHILREDGAGLLDVHGDLYEHLCAWISSKALNQPDPEEYLKNIVLIDFTDSQAIPGINPLEPVPGISSDRQANQLVLIFRRFYKDRWGVKIEELARFGFMALIESGDTLLELEDFFVNEGFRNHVLSKVKTEEVKNYFHHQFQSDKQYIGGFLNKLRPLLLDNKIKAVIGQTKSTINFREILDQEKIMLVNLNKSYLSANADIMAAIFVGWIQSAALSRRNIPASRRRPYFLYVDEFQNFANDQFEEILAESRKYSLFLTMAHQSISQLETKLRHITLGNTDIHCFFRLEAGDAETLAKGTFEVRGGMEKPALTPRDTETDYYTEQQELRNYAMEMGNLQNRFFYYRHKGKPYKARLVYSLDVIPPWKALEMDVAEFQKLSRKAIGISKQHYTRPFSEVLEEICKRRQAIKQTETQVKKKTKKADIQDIIPDIAELEDE